MKFHVNGSINTSNCSIQVSPYESNVSITLGVQEILIALDDILSDIDMMHEEDFQKMLDMAGQIQSLAIVRETNSICANCKRTICKDCEILSKIYGK